jgi:predicted ATPase
MIERPSGTVTFLITDIEQSTRRWEEAPDAMREALARHDDTLKKAIERHGGWLFKHTGDGVLAAFATPRSAIDAAITAQRALELPVRMGVCTGEAEMRGDDYFGPALNRAARIMAAGHGRQVLVAASTAAIVDGFSLADLGEHRLRDLSQPLRLYQVRAEGLKEEFPPLKTLNFARGNLPAQATSFLGREKELKEVTTLLHSVRLLTLTGVGGVGKTRLAIQAAAETSAEYRDGTWFVELAAVGEPAALSHAVAGVLGVTLQTGKTIEQSIVAALSTRRLLLVLDNCEHLIEVAASLAQQILAHCPEVILLATTREALIVDGERIYPVPSLNFGDGAQSPAVQLFVDRARAVVAEFELGGEAAAVGQICQRLDGIPLAIELAAARTRAMSPSQIRDRLAERFRLLTGGSRRALERHQTLRNAVQWSYDLLSPAERAVLARSAVFAGGFTLEAAECVCSGHDVDPADILDLLDSLVRKSLVTVDRSGSVLRYGLLETIRQFAEEQCAVMSESDAIRIRHAQYFAADSDAQFEAWLSPGQLAAYEWLDREMDNLRAAFHWAKEQPNIDAAARIASNIGDMARFRLRDEAANWAQEIVAAARAVRHKRLAVLLTWAASSAWSFGRLEEAKHFGSEAIALAGEPGFDPFVWAYADLAMVASYKGDLDQAVHLVDTGAKHDADRHDRFCLAMLLYFKAISGHIDDAMKIADEVVAAVETTGIPCTICIAYWAKGETYGATNPAVALQAYERAVAIARQSGNRLWEQVIAPKIAALQAQSGDPIDALRSFRQMLISWRQSNDLMLASHGLGSLIVLFGRLGRVEAAATLHGALTKNFEPDSFIAGFSDAIGRIRIKLGDANFGAANSRGNAMTLHEATDYVLDQIAQALAADGLAETVNDNRFGLESGRG